MGFNPGDISVDSVLVTSPVGGSRDYAGATLTASILETIFTPGVTGEIQVIDDNDWLGQLELQGNETVYIQFTVLDSSSTIYYNFHLNKITFEIGRAHV